MATGGATDVEGHCVYKNKFVIHVLCVYVSIITVCRKVAGSIPDVVIGMFY
jgi:hypothetical protein